MCSCRGASTIISASSVDSMVTLPIGDGVADGLRLRHDHGSNYLADYFQQEVAFFGIESSPSFVRAPEGNVVAERFIRTLKENLLWVRSFETIEDLRLALLAFKRTYNEQWMSLFSG